MIQPLAYVHPDAKIAPNVVIEPFAVIHKNVEIGEGSWIGSNVTIFEGARIGKNVQIFPGASISAVPQDLKFEGEETLTIIGDYTTIRECVTINKGTKAAGKTVIGSHCLLMAYTHIAHDCVIGDHCIMANSVQMAGHVELGDWAFIGGTTAIHQFSKIGPHAMIGGGSHVLKDIPPYTKAGREPIAYVGLNSIGLRRRGFSNEKIAEIQEIYRYVYLKGYNNAEALHRIEIELPASAERDEIINFIRSSERGIMKGPGKGTSVE
ncbi:acyl-ACP--UDP-N-acetylglucosamine O-acyltransferase [Siphonobacter curvatus]|uniref:Acyl-[acyl-carrier-protein]--UDP-N-acetylglucosamine O-acyltransferase n=1 Tax=Siphonobacter curvatus TaxID=2094562 RepID=A0A2S7IL03_9BACT|nr:acyl-ACP--UDP-N-acetylglucosamine O-acyltransferase [Siphonobacter curvatus]PQA58336.1 acyl-[acyl-carrier-protein]--UDP-N-acetylglucosamine O-acyltransferase [Siphonobacter curvatus]